MNKFCFYTILLFLVYSCSEGEIIETEVNFEASIENCANLTDRAYVFYKIEDTQKRSLSVNFTDTAFEITPNVDDISTEEPTTIALNATNNQLIYREYDSEINGEDYFCSSVPASGITVIDELISTEGTINISYTALEATSNTQERYTRTITVENATLEGDGITLRKELILLGSDTIEANVSIEFTGDLQSCESTGDMFTLYKVNTNANRAITLNFSDTAFEIIPEIDSISEDEPITITLDGINNTLTYREFDTSLEAEQTEDYFCNDVVPDTVQINRELVSSGGELVISYTEVETQSDDEVTSRTFTRTYTVNNLVIEGTGTPILIESLVLDTEQIIIEL